MQRRQFLRRVAPAGALALGGGCLGSTLGGGDPVTVDEPPHEVGGPNCDDEDGSNPLWLCGDMPSEPSLTFEEVDPERGLSQDVGLDHDEHSTVALFATLLTSTEDLDRVFAAPDEGDSQEGPLAQTDFDSEAILFVQTGFGPAKTRPHLRRIEETDDGIHAHGCYENPCAITRDLVATGVVVRLERPDATESGSVSLTIDHDTRVTFPIDEGPFTVDTSGES